MGQKFRGKITLHFFTFRDLSAHEGPETRSLRSSRNLAKQVLACCRRPVCPQQLGASIQRDCPRSHINAAAAGAGEATKAFASGNSRREASARCNPCGKMPKVQRPPIGTLLGIARKVW